MAYAPLLTFVHKALQRKDAVTTDKIISVHTQHRIAELDPVLTEAICRAAVNVIVGGQQVHGRIIGVGIPARRTDTAFGAHAARCPKGFRDSV